MKLLVLTEKYPLKENKTLMYIHTRNIYYNKCNIETTVLNFSANFNYYMDGIKVITIKEFIKNKKKYDEYLLVLHAPNLKHHYKFLKKYGENFKKIVFFFYGHEVLKINKVYSKPYKYIKKNLIKKAIQNIYDDIKLYIWKKYFTKTAYKSYFIFVSKWMYDEFMKWTKINPEVVEGRCSITYNGVGEQFEKSDYDYNKIKKYDFVTIRANLDGSKYSIDIVNELAKKNPQYKFLVVGKGEFFNHNQKAQNLQWIDKVLDHEKIIEVLNDSKCALMPTRTDAQGLMMCEMATFGIPLITSDIPVCHEVFDDFQNVALLDNKNIEKNDLNELYKKIKNKKEKNDKYFYKNTCSKEIEIFEKIIKGE